MCLAFRKFESTSRGQTKYYELFYFLQILYAVCISYERFNDNWDTLIYSLKPWGLIY